jgi:cytochrome P450
METLADSLIAELKEKRRADLSQISLKMAVAVASRVVGLTNSRLPRMDKRLDAFFDRPTARFEWLAKAVEVLRNRHMLSFFYLDVKPAIAARRQHPQEDVISHLLELGYSDPEILTECVTYAAAGMVTTREFISVVTWHMLEAPALKERYLVAGEEERYAILHEILRVEPVVAHLFRRTTEDITLESEGHTVTIPKGDLIDMHIYATNSDEQVVGEDGEAVCPARPLHGEHISEMLMSFGDGAHRCPGAYVAIQETDIFLQRLLAIPTLRIEKVPDLSYNDLAKSYEVRNFVLVVD